MGRHTPGPWVAKLGYTPTVHAGDTLLCVPSARADEIGGRQLSELHANARLIAAAPDLLEACKAALARLEPFTKMHSPDMVSEVKAVRAAIARAEGKEPPS